MRAQDCTRRTTFWSIAAVMLFATGILVPGGPPTPLRNMALRIAAAQGYNPDPDPRSGIDDHHYLGGSGANVGALAGAAQNLYGAAMSSTSPQVSAYAEALTAATPSPGIQKVRALLSRPLQRKLKPGFVPDERDRRRLNVELNRLLLRGRLEERLGSPQTRIRMQRAEETLGARAGLAARLQENRTTLNDALGVELRPEVLPFRARKFEPGVIAEIWDVLRRYDIPDSVLQIGAGARVGDRVTAVAPDLRYSNSPGSFDITARAFHSAGKGYSVGIHEDLSPSRRTQLRALGRIRAIQDMLKPKGKEARNPFPDFIAAYYQWEHDHRGEFERAFNHSIRALRYGVGVDYRDFSDFGGLIDGGVSASRLYRAGAHDDAPGMGWVASVAAQSLDPDRGGSSTGVRTSFGIYWQDRVPKLYPLPAPSAYGAAAGPGDAQSPARQAPPAGLDAYLRPGEAPGAPVGGAYTGAPAVPRYGMIRDRLRVGIEYTPRNSVFRRDTYGLSIRYRHEPGVVDHRLTGLKARSLDDLYENFTEYTLSVTKREGSDYLIGFRISKLIGL